MDDSEIVALFFARNETAIEESRKKYGRYCRYIALQILGNDEDAAEIESDAMLKAWQTIPPYRPGELKAYLGMLSRQIALNAYNRKHADRRGGALSELFDELGDCVPADQEDVSSEIALKDALDVFLHSLTKRQRGVFLRRYWYSNSIGEIAKEFKMSEGSVKMLLMRIRNKLKKHLKKEGFSYEE